MLKAEILYMTKSIAGVKPSDCIKISISFLTEHLQIFSNCWIRVVIKNLCLLTNNKINVSVIN